MPIITVDLFEGRSRGQIAAFSKAVTEAATQILKAPLEHTWVVFNEHPKSKWAMGGKLCDAELPQACSTSAAQGSCAPTMRRKSEGRGLSDSAAGGRPAGRPGGGRRARRG